MNEVREAMGMSLEYEAPRAPQGFEVSKMGEEAKIAFDGTAALDLGPTLVANSAPREQPTIQKRGKRLPFLRHGGRCLRRAAGPAAAPDPQAGHRHLRYSDREESPRNIWLTSKNCANWM